MCTLQKLQMDSIQIYHAVKTWNLKPVTHDFTWTYLMPSSNHKGLKSMIR